MLLTDLIRLEGTTKLWRGLTPTTYRHLIYTGSRMTIYETLRDLYANPETKQMDAQQLLFRTIGLGIFAGALGQFMASPVDLVKVRRSRLPESSIHVYSRLQLPEISNKFVSLLKKVRMQLDGQLIARGLPPRVLSVSSALIQTVREGGIRSLWKGGAPNVARASLVNLGDLTAYDRSKKTIMEHTSLGDTYWTHSIASGCAGLVSAVLATPADVIRTRVMNQPTDSHGRGTLYSSSTDCLVKTVKYEGVPALYRGFFPLWARLAPWSFIFWVSYEKLRGAAGLESF